MNADHSNEPLLDENGEIIKSKTQLKQEAEDMRNSMKFHLAMNCVKLCS
jgi:hypothetical protein